MYLTECIRVYQRAKVGSQPKAELLLSTQCFSFLQVFSVDAAVCSCQKAWKVRLKYKSCWCRKLLSMEDQKFIEVLVLIQDTELEDLKSSVSDKGGRVTVQTGGCQNNSLNNSESD